MPWLFTPCVPAGTLAESEQPTLAVDGLILRPWTDTDVDVLLDAFADPDIRRWHVRSVEDRDEGLTVIAEYAEAWRAETAAQWLIADAADGTALGRVAIRGIDLTEG